MSGGSQPDRFLFVLFYLSVSELGLMSESYLISSENTQEDIWQTVISMIESVFVFIQKGHSTMGMWLLCAGSHDTEDCK